jgi:hypothetical protein
MTDEKRDQLVVSFLIHLNSSCCIDQTIDSFYRNTKMNFQYINHNSLDQTIVLKIGLQLSTSEGAYI